MKSLADEPGREAPTLQVAILSLVLGALAMLAVAVHAPANLLQNNENRMAAYVEDIVSNGQWICPHDALGRLASKPPAYAWLSALVALATQRVGVAALYAPSVLSVLGIAAVLLVAGRRLLGPAAGFLAALAWLISPVSAWLMATARYDGLFTLFVLLSALAAYRAWQTGRGWTGFWLAAAAASLVKGPLGIVLGGAGLLAVFWEHGSGEPIRLRGSHLLGLLLFVLIAGGWFALARWKVGPELVHRMIGEELIGNALGREGTDSAHHWYRPLVSWVERLAPWSLAAVIALGRIFVRPDPNHAARRLERFLAIAIAIGLLIFTLTPHREARLVLPLVPLGALLAGQEMARWTVRWPWRRSGIAFAAVALLVLGSLAFAHVAQQARHTATRETAALQLAANQWAALAGAGFPLTHVDTPIPFQLGLDEIRPETAAAAAADLLLGDTAAFVALRDSAWLYPFGITPENGFRPVATWPSSGEPLLALVGNRPRPDWNEPIACLVGTLELRLKGLRLVKGTARRVIVRPLHAAGHLRITNRGIHSEVIRVEVEGWGEHEQHRTLAPGETWSIGVGSGSLSGSESTPIPIPTPT